MTPGRVPNWWRAKGGRKPQAYVLEDGSIVDEEGKQVSQVSGEVAQALHLNSETTQSLLEKDKKDLEMTEVEVDAAAAETMRQQIDPFGKTVDVVDPFDSDVEAVDEVGLCTPCDDEIASDDKQRNRQIKTSAVRPKNNVLQSMSISPEPRQTYCSVHCGAADDHLQVCIGYDC